MIQIIKYFVITFVLYGKEKIKIKKSTKINLNKVLDIINDTIKDITHITILSSNNNCFYFLLV